MFISKDNSEIYKKVSKKTRMKVVKPKKRPVSTAKLTIDPNESFFTSFKKTFLASFKETIKKVLSGK